MTETFPIFREHLDRSEKRTIPEISYAPSVLTRERRPLGYIDVAALKAKWEAGKADPVRLITSSDFSSTSDVGISASPRTTKFPST
jgi:hypothetical protein